MIKTALSINLPEVKEGTEVNTEVITEVDAKSVIDFHSEDDDKSEEDVLDSRIKKKR